MDIISGALYGLHDNLLALLQIQTERQKVEHGMVYKGIIEET